MIKKRLDISSRTLFLSSLILLFVLAFQHPALSQKTKYFQEKKPYLKTSSPSTQLKIDTGRMRNLSRWKPEISRYSQRHYHEPTWKLKPKAIILHYTATSDFPWNLVNSTSFAGERPGLASHYVIKGNKIWRILPDDVRSRGCWGMNHIAINIEIVALNATDLSHRKTALDTTARLVKYLMKKHNIPITRIHSHQQVAKMNPKITPGVKDFVDSTPYGKIDPGKKNMKYILKKVKSLK